MLPEWMQDPEGLALLARCKENPRDIAPRLILADWLEEREDEEFVRCFRKSLAETRRELFGERTKSRFDPFVGCVDGWLVIDPNISSFPDSPWFASLSASGFDELSIEELIIRLANDNSARNLCILEIQNVLFFNLNLSNFSNLPLEQLRRLNLSNCSLRNTGVRELLRSKSLIHLNELIIIKNHIGPEAARELFASSLLKKLRSLDISHNNFGDEEIIALANQPDASQIVELRANRLEMTASGLHAILTSPHLRNIVNLALEFCQIGDAGLAELAVSPLLGRTKEWSFRGCGIGDAGVEALSQSPNLMSVTKLDLSANAIADSGAIALAGSQYVSSLKYLHLNMMSGPGVGPEGVRALSTSEKLCNLEELFVDGRGYHYRIVAERTINSSIPNSAIEVARSPFLTRLKSLELSHQDFGDEGMIELANSPVLRNVTRLSVQGNYLTDAGAIALANSPYLKQVTELNLSHNQFGEIGAMALINSPILAEKANVFFIDCLLDEDRAQALSDLKSGRISIRGHEND